MKFAQPLLIRSNCLSRYNIFRDVCLETVPENLKIPYQLSIMSLKSKQCNEPYEILLADLLGVRRLTSKHGWDAVDDEGQVYEFKPTSTQQATINDDSMAKIQKCETEKGWLVLARINRESFSFDWIYKFPLDVFSASRREHLDYIMNKNQATNSTHKKQTRVVYTISLKKSIQLCSEQQKPYYFRKV